MLKKRYPSASQQIQLNTSLIALEVYENGLAIVRIQAHENKNSLSSGLIHGLKESFDYIRQTQQYRAVVLSGFDNCFILEPAEGEWGTQIQTMLLECELPVVTAMNGDASGLGWLIALCCEDVVYADEAQYSYRDMAFGRIPRGGATLIFPTKFDDYLAREILFIGKAYTGAELKTRGGCISVCESEVEHTAVAIASKWTLLAQQEVYQLKQEISQSLRAKLSDACDQESQMQQQITLPSPRRLSHTRRVVAELEFDSEVVTFEVKDNDVVLITLCDRQSKNTFSDALAKGLIAAFEHIKSNPDYKVVVLTGYESYFACGGSKQGLLAIQNGSMKFTDVMIYSLALECEIPVIAAMQGHAIGAGWSMGMFCDFAVFSEESVYVSNYMRYGFTPGAGATLIFPQRFGEDLAQEILFTAKEYKGHELKARGITMPVVPRAEVKNHALAIAKQLAVSTRLALTLLKNQLCQNMRKQLDDTYRQEVAMHEKTFVGNSAVLDKIQSTFDALHDAEPEKNHLPKTAEPETSELEASAMQTSTVPVAIPLENTTAFTDLESIRCILRNGLASELYMQADSVDDELQFIDMGLDSVTGVTWIRKMNEQFKLSIAATKVYDYPTINTLANYVLTKINQQEIKQQEIKQQETKQQPTAALQSTRKISPVKKEQITPSAAELTKHIEISSGSKVPGSKAPPKSKIQSINENRPYVVHSNPCALGSEKSKRAGKRDKPTLPQAPAIAVIGMSGQFPHAKNLAEFWQNLANARDCISDIPANRWLMDHYYDPDPNVPGKSYANRMGVLADVDKFDPLFFNISPAEAKLIEPQQRLFLENCWASVEDSGLSPTDVAGSRCGVFVGCGISGYGQGLTAQDLMGGAASILSARISYLLDLKGPCLAIDTACSSSLVAIAEACNSLTLGTSDMAFAGGVCVLTGPEMHVMASKAGMLSKDNRCYTFDTRANGFVPGEGVGVVLLKRLADAVADRDPIAGVISGWGVNQDGKTNGITAPSVSSQTQLEKEIYQRFNINPETISLVETHGTGTPLGDPIEVEALTTAFQAYTRKKNYCALGAVKSNIGHLMPAAGISGAIKVLLALQHKMLPPTINFKTLNEHICLDDSPFYVNTELKPWQVAAGQTQRAAVSSFGFSGTNAHIVIENYQPDSASTVARSNGPIKVVAKNPCVFVLSAKSEKQLKIYAQRMQEFVQSQQALNLLDMTYTLQLGREAMAFRLAVLADSNQALLDGLQSFIQGGSSAAIIYAKVSKSKGSAAIFETDDDAKVLLQTWFKKRKLEKLARLWVNGLNIDWPQLHSDANTDNQPRRINLPTYPFADERYWNEGPGLVVGGNASSPTMRLVDNSSATNDQKQDDNHAKSAEPGVDYRKYVLQKLTAIVAKITNIPAANIDVDSDFEVLGLDSIMIASLNHELETWIGKLDSSLFFKYKNLNSLATYLETHYPNKLKPELRQPELSGSDSFKAKKPEPPKSESDKAKRGLSSHTQAPEMEIAIIGMSGKYPQASNLSEYWRNLAEGRDCISEIPLERFDYRPFYSPDKNKKETIYMKWGGFLDNIDQFDALFFNVSPQDARQMDPQERLFLESAWQCLESAGYINPHWQKQARNIGVFAGATFNNYQLIAADARDQKFLSPVNSQIFSIANHVSYFFNFTGPSLTVDTACSASLYAIHLACESIKRGEAEMALAGGVNLSLHPSKYFTICSRGFGASDGRCHAFADGGDGYVPSEGVGSVLLKPYANAKQDGDTVLALIKGTGVSHDGKTQSYTVPNPVAQSKAIDAAFKQAAISPESVSYVEAHGTGTPLGDPIEITGLMDTFSKYTDKKQFCSIGSVKSNIGHGEAVAGIAQLSKAVLQIQHKTLVPSLLHGELNPNIDFENTAFYLQQAKTPWKQPVIDGKPVPRRAGISSFGAGGVNVHIIIEEPRCSGQSSVRQQLETSSSVIIPFSAHLKSQLAELVQNFIFWLEDNYDDCEIADVAYTLQAKRAAFRYRLAFVVENKKKLLRQLKLYLSSDQVNESNNRFYAADSKVSKDNPSSLSCSEEDQSYLKILIKQYETDALAKLWVNGTDIHWEHWYSKQQKYQCLHLPTYAFLKKSYWINDVINPSDSQSSTDQKQNLIKNFSIKQCADTPSMSPSFERDIADTIKNSDLTTDNAVRPGLSALLESIFDLSDVDREEQLKEFLSDQIKSVLGFDSDDAIDADLGFFELGMESMQALGLQQSLENQLSMTLSDTVLFDFPTINGLASHVLSSIQWEQIAELISDQAGAESRLDLPTLEKKSLQDEPIKNQVEFENVITVDIENLSEEALLEELLNELD